jgi:hypothetical protein
MDSLIDYLEEKYSVPPKKGHKPGVGLRLNFYDNNNKLVQMTLISVDYVKVESHVAGKAKPARVSKEVRASLGVSAYEENVRLYDELMDMAAYQELAKDARRS